MRERFGCTQIPEYQLCLCYTKHLYLTIIYTVKTFLLLFSTVLFQLHVYVKKKIKHFVPHKILPLLNSSLKCRKLALACSELNIAVSLTFSVSKAPSCLAELDHISKNKHHWPYSKNDPCDPALHLPISCHDALPRVLNQHKLFNEIVHSTSDHHCTY